MQKIPELVCPAGNLPALKTGCGQRCGHGLHGFERCDQCTKLSGTEFRYEICAGRRSYAHARGRNVLMAINTFAQAGQVERWHAAVDTAADLVPMRLLLPTPPSWRMRQTNIRIYACICRYKVRPPLRSYQYDERAVRHPSCRFAARADHRSGQTCN